MDKLDPPVQLENPDNQASAEFILNLGSKEPSDYTEVRQEFAKSVTVNFFYENRSTLNM
jgi:hypothetical protein